MVEKAGDRNVNEKMKAHKIKIAKESPSKKPPLKEQLADVIPPMPPDTKSLIAEVISFVLVFVLVFAIIGVVLYSDSTPSGTLSPQPNPQPSSNVRYVEIEVNYSGHWSASFMVESDSSSVDSYGSQRAGLNLTKGTYYYFSAQKMEGGYEKLELRLYSDGNQVKYAFTNSEYGIASVAWIVE